MPPRPTPSPVFWRYHCTRCDGIHYEHRRLGAFIRSMVKHAARCGTHGRTMREVNEQEIVQAITAHDKPLDPLPIRMVSRAPKRDWAGR